MKDTFEEYTAMFPAYLKSLEEMQMHSRQEPRNELPTAGIYVFYKDGIPQYVGRTGRLKERLREHGSKSSSHFSASFAFLMAKEQAVKNGIDCKRKRGELQSCPLFKPLFDTAKVKVAAMEFRCVKVEDPIEQTLFEVYVAIKLKTPYNKFDPH